MKKMLFLAIITPLFLCLSAQSEKPSPSILERLNKVSSSAVFNASKQSSTLKAYGENLMNASPLPLIIVNGGVYQRGIYTINPIDAQSIIILKDAAATTAYGMFGKDGIISVELKIKNISTAPLIIINGNLREDMSSIEHRKVKSTTVLFDARAKILCGETGEKKGVIVIETKRKNKEEKLSQRRLKNAMKGKYKNTENR